MPDVNVVDPVDVPEVNLEPDDPVEEVTADVSPADDPVDENLVPEVPVDPARKLDLTAFPEETPEAAFTAAT